jgi:hypothetical protein
MSYPNVPITPTPDALRRFGQAINYLLTQSEDMTTDTAFSFDGGDAFGSSGFVIDGGTSSGVADPSIILDGGTA